MHCETPCQSDTNTSIYFVLDNNDAFNDLTLILRQRITMRKYEQIAHFGIFYALALGFDQCPEIR